jgi:hypothetical protein
MMGAIRNRAGFPLLGALPGPTAIDGLTKDQFRELQVGLSLLGYPIGEIDGKIGPKSRNAWAEFKTQVVPGNAALIGPESVVVLRDKVLEIAGWEEADFANKEGTIAAIRGMCRSLGIGLPAQIAYVLATAQWETAQTFKPVKEAFWLSEEWRRRNLSYFPYYGRGYVQLTWKSNYKTYSDIFDLDMVTNRDLALDPSIALFVLVHGFKVGTFTHRKITDFINEGATDFVSARFCINGTDKAHEIADLAENFLNAM